MRKPEIRCVCEPHEKARFDKFWENHKQEFDFTNKGDLVLYLINELINECEEEKPAAKKPS